jgi:catechol 2,3-dioxygenase-like lactoylglutathione lyase family enzyme
MIHHLDFTVTNFEKSRSFYIRALAPLALALVMERERVAGFGQLPDPVFWIRKGTPLEGRMHIAFLAQSREAVDAFHREAIAAGGTDNGAPGLRPRYADHYYAAFVLDPDGHNIEAVCRVTEA